MCNVEPPDRAITGAWPDADAVAVTSSPVTERDTDG